MPRFVCPGCRNRFDVLPEHLGQVVRCPTCGEMLATDAGGGGRVEIGGPGSPSTGPHVRPISQAGPEPAEQPTAVPPPAVSGPGWPAQPPHAPGGGGNWPGGAGGPAWGDPSEFSSGPRRKNPAGLVSLLLGLATWAGYLIVNYAVVRATNFQPSSFSEMIARSRELQARMPAWVGPAWLGLTLLALAGLIVGLYAISRRRAKKGAAIAGVVIGALNSCCCGLGAISMLLRR